MDLITLTAILFAFGLLVGSFVNVLILRLPESKSLGGRSHCPHCRHILSSRDLIPVLSFVLLRGKCRYCKARISKRYPTTELVTALMFAFAGTVVNQNERTWLLSLIFILLTIIFLIVVFVVDFEHYVILDVVVFPAAAVFLLLRLLEDFIIPTVFFRDSSLVSGLLAALAGFIFFGAIWLFSRGRWMGLGDVKFMIPFGLILGFPLVFVGIMSSFIIGSLVSIPLLISGSKQLKSRVPFGTFLAAALVFAMFWGEPVLNWYLALIGLR